ncbi:hypothetical protein TPDSL_40700 (plasmid) [Terrisporobacter petrolearius]|uniref:hypothetical protein n=1 Tax=Terrisporobacter petrolearius TaxID=1460447 RepID=UPI0032426B8C
MKRDKIIPFRVNENEFNEINNYCNVNELDKSELIRSLVLNEIKPIKEVTTEMLDRAIKSQFKRVLTIDYTNQRLIVANGTRTENYTYELINKNRKMLIKLNGAIQKEVNI